MTDQTKKNVALWIKAILNGHEWSAARLAKEAGVAPSTITRALDMNNKFVPSTRTIQAITSVSLPHIPNDDIRKLANQLRWSDAKSTGGESALRRVPILGEVRAGAWLEISDVPEPTEWIYFDDDEFSRARLFALIVVGNSMDRIYPDGTTVIVADATEASVFEGDVVVVRRQRANLFETTLKEIESSGSDTYVLWPRSTDPAHQEPIRINREEAADEGAQIIGVVIASYAKRKRRSRRMISFAVPLMWVACALAGQLFTGTPVHAQTTTNCYTSGRLTSCDTTPHASFGGGFSEGLESGSRLRERMEARRAARQDAAAEQAKRDRDAHAGQLVASGQCADARTYALAAGDFELAQQVATACSH